jgi:hypothetical protein
MAYRIYLITKTHWIQQEFEDIKGVIRIRKSTKNKQHNNKKKKEHKDKQRSTKHAYKTRVTRTPLKTTTKRATNRAIQSLREYVMDINYDIDF